MIMGCATHFDAYVRSEHSTSIGANSTVTIIRVHDHNKILKTKRHLFACMLCFYEVIVKVITIIYVEY